MKCEDCIHYEKCSEEYEHIFGNKYENEVETICNTFKDKSLFVELPCKVGDRVYTIDIGSNGKRHIEETQIAEIRVYVDGIYYQDHLGVWLFEVFLTREEAEKRLKELQE